jgi:diguanylate cyclase (GGDEF)-like protein
VDITSRTGEFEQINNDLDRKVFDLHSLLKAGEALYDVLEVSGLAALLMAMCRERARVDKIAVLLHDGPEDDRKLQVRAAFGLPEEVLEIAGPATDGILWRLLLAGEPFSVVTPDGEHRFPYIFGEHGLGALEGQLWIPLVMPDRVVGLVSVGLDHDGDPIRARDREFLGALCSQAAVAINTANLYESIEIERAKQARSFHQLQILFDVTKKLGEVEELNEMLSLILTKAIGAVEAKKGSLMLVEEETQELVIHVVEGLPDKSIQDKINRGEIQCRRFKEGDGVAGQVWETGLPYRVNAGEEDGNFTDRAGSHVDSIMCVPMHADDEFIGVINITNRTNDAPFEASDESILQALADQAAVAIRKKRLWLTSVTDDLTGLFLRNYATGRLRKEIKRSKRYGHDVSLIMCDIDHFKLVNDTYGHPIGDAVIINAAKTLLDGVREDIDVASRWGGEEFFIILPETDLEGGKIAAERLRAAFEAMITPLEDGSPLQKTMSFGVTILGPDDTPASITKRADDALYRSKETGRNRVTAWSFDEGVSHTEASEDDSVEFEDESLALMTSPDMQAPTEHDGDDEAAAQTDG